MKTNNLEKLFEINKEYSGKHVLKRKAMVFAVRILDLSEDLVNAHKTYRIADQLISAGTSIGANSSEAYRGVSKADFLHKLSISQKETSESKFWLSLCFAKGYISEELYGELWREADELDKIISSSILTTKSRNYANR